MVMKKQKFTLEDKKNWAYYKEEVTSRVDAESYRKYYQGLIDKIDALVNEE